MEQAADTTIKKVATGRSPTGRLGALELVSGKRAALRFWREDAGESPESTRDYETLGYVLRGRAELVVEDQTVRLEPGDAWLVPPGASHHYRVSEAPFEAVEATSPPAHLRGRDAPPAAGS